ncbi:MAG: hypothetical protein SXA11_02885 [Cyanobacteriota bacterium]|nr:hypothetical protein [Cyanobacteriota bacterium]
MKGLTSIDSNSNFQSHQIVCLEHENSFLYAEVIQVIEARKTCWVRPLMFKILSYGDNKLSDFPESQTIFDLRESSDLVLPISLFRVALDTEVIPLLSELDAPKNQERDLRIARRELREFVQQVWQAYKPLFSQTKK